MATVDFLATLVGGEVEGDGTKEITDVADLASAGPGHLSFLANPKYERAARSSRAGALLVSQPLSDCAKTFIVCANPYLALAQVATHLHPPAAVPPGVAAGAWVHPSARVDASAAVCAGAVVDAGARVGARSTLMPGAFVGTDAVIGDDALLHPGAKVLARCIVGSRSILHAGAVIGSDGFGYAPDAEGRRHKIPQVGIVELGEDVEVGANTTIDRATFGATRVGRGTKIDNLVQIAHNVQIGADCVIVSQTGIAGSAALGDRVVLGAQAGVVGHISICDDVVFGARSGVAGDIDRAGVYSGTPTMPHKEWLRVVMSQGSVPKLRTRVRELEQRIDELERRLTK